MNICKTCQHWKIQLRDDHKAEHRRYGYCTLPQYVGVMAKLSCEDHKSKEPWPKQMQRARVTHELDKLRAIIADEKKP